MPSRRVPSGGAGYKNRVAAATGARYATRAYRRAHRRRTHGGTTVTRQERARVQRLYRRGVRDAVRRQLSAYRPGLRGPARRRVLLKRVGRVMRLGRGDT